MGQAAQDSDGIVKHFIVVDGDHFHGAMSMASDAETIRIARTLLGAYRLPQVEIDDRDDARHVIAILIAMGNCGKSMRKRLLAHVVVCLSMSGFIAYRAIASAMPLGSLVLPIMAMVAFAITGTRVLMSPFNDMMGRFDESIACLSDSGSYHVGHDSGVLAEVSYVVHPAKDDDGGDAAGDGSADEEDDGNGDGAMRP